MAASKAQNLLDYPKPEKESETSIHRTSRVLRVTLADSGLSLGWKGARFVHSIRMMTSMAASQTL